ncbi:MAG: tRNA epoxyqueuosine(34) reductase QueG [Gemmatimonadaceae bacterium]
MGNQPGLNAEASAALAGRIKSQAYALGFDLCGIAALGEARSYPEYQKWLSLGRAGQMAYMAAYQEQRHDQRLVHPGATSAIVVAMNYGGRQPPGPIARYARGDDYHHVIRQRLRELQRWLEGEVGHSISARPYVDTAPILERDLGHQAGLGWVGKNTNLIHPRTGSFFFLGSLFVSLELPPDQPFDADHCGTCTRCIDACPTGAIVAPRELDARLCVSYLTIEQRGAIPEPLRPAIGELLYGCDICQDVCPWNVKFSSEPTVTELAPRPENVVVDPAQFLDDVRVDYARRTQGSAMQRAHREGLARNAAVAIGNRARGSDEPALDRAQHDEHALVREHATWARNRLHPPE